MIFISLLTALITLALVSTVAFAETVYSAPRLILQITVDQLRGDLPGRYADRYAQQINRLVHPVDIASTLSACVGSKPPSAAAGEPLLEVLNR